MNGHWMIRSVLARSAQGAACLALLLVASAHAATFTVTTTANNGPGSLRTTMVSVASAAAPPHEIVFSLPAESVIVLSSSLPIVNGRSITISGNGVPGLVIDGNGQDRVFAVGDTGTLTLRDLTVRNGFSGNGAGGGCMASSGGAIVIQRSRFTECVALSAGSMAQGGAIESQGMLFISDASFENNRSENVAGPAYGGAIRATAAATIERSTFRNNIAQGTTAASGGAMLASQVTVTRSQFVGNASRSGSAINTAGGALASFSSPVTIRQSLFFDNEAARGSAVFYQGSSQPLRVVELSNNTMVGNRAGPAMELSHVIMLLKNNSWWKNGSRDGEPGHLRLAGIAMVNALSNNYFAPTSDGSAACAPDSGYSSTSGVARNLVVDTSCSLLDAGRILAPNEGRFIRALRRTDSQYHDTPVIELLAGSLAIDAGFGEVPPGTVDGRACTAGDARDEDRPADGNADGLSVCDVGATELQREASLFADDMDPVLLR